MAEIKQYVFFDFEMLCNNHGMPYEDMEAIRLGAVKHDLVTGEVAKFDRYIKPESRKRLSKFCKELTGISDEDLIGADAFGVVFEDFLTWIGGVKKTRFFSWSKSDISRLKLDAQRHEISQTTIKKIEQRYIDFQAIFTQRVTKNNVSVENGLSLYGLNFIGEKHNPMYDALNTMRIYQSFLNERVQSDLIMLKHFIFPGEEPFEVSEINRKLMDQLNKDVVSLYLEIKDVYKLKDGKKLLKQTQRLVEKYSNIVINRSGLFSEKVIDDVRMLVSFYHDLLFVYQEHELHCARIMILHDGMLNPLKKLAV